MITDGKYPTKVFKNDKDVLDVIELIISDTKEFNEMEGKSFDIASSVSQQLSFFSCKNIMINRESQKDISQYIYCKDFNMSPFPGSYMEQPARWISKVNIIKNAMSKREERLYNKAQKEANRDNKGI